MPVCPDALALRSTTMYFAQGIGRRGTQKDIHVWSGLIVVPGAPYLCQILCGRRLNELPRRPCGNMFTSQLRAA